MANIFYGTNYSETIDGTDYADDIYGRGGDDVIYGYGGADYLDGGSGGDILYGGVGSDILVGGTGINDLWGGSGYDRFAMSVRSTAGASDDLVQDFQFDADVVDLRSWGVSDFSQVQALLQTDSYGDATLNAYYAGYDHLLTLNNVATNELLASDFLFANPAAINRTGTAYDDVLFGSRQNDILRGSGGFDILLGGIGNDDLYGDAGDDELIGGAGSDFMVGGNGSDLLQGDAGDDWLTGQIGRDILEGGSGNDILIGGAEYDFLQGGVGADTFRFNNGDFGGATPATADRIDDFFRSEGDRIDLASVDANVQAAGNQAFSFIGTQGFSHAAGQLRYAQVNGNTFVYGDQNGDAVADFAIRVDGTINMQAGDFLL